MDSPTTPRRPQQAQIPHAGRVVVVGAGVSGCSAALGLASQGIPVLLLNSGLDSVGLPGYGPELTGNGGVPGGAPTPPPQDDAEHVLKALGEAAPALRDVWLEHAWTWKAAVGDAPSTPAGSGVVIDRRAVSLGTKWRIENEELIELRQGLAVSIEAREGTGVVVRSVFGEEFPGRVALVAVGLALGGRICVAEQETPGGRYGEVAADALLDQLRSRGARFKTVEIPVGARLRSAGSALRMVRDLADRVGGYSIQGASSGASWVQVTLRPLAAPEDLSTSGSESERDSRCHPPSPYDSSGVRGPRTAYMVRTVAQAAKAADLEESALHSSSGRPHAATPAVAGFSRASSALGLMPDGIATGEWYLTPEALAALGVGVDAGVGLDVGVCVDVGAGAGADVDVDADVGVRLEGAVQTSDRKTIDALVGSMTRPPHTIRGFVSSGGEGRLLPRVWVAGQAAGASGYVASLSGGWRVGLAIADELTRNGDLR